MTIPLLGSDRVRVSAHVDVYKNDEQGRPTVLVSTTRPCAECGAPLVGVVISVNKNEQVHAACRKEAGRG